MMLIIVDGLATESTSNKHVTTLNIQTEESGDYWSASATMVLAKNLLVTEMHVVVRSRMESYRGTIVSAQKRTSNSWQQAMMNPCDKERGYLKPIHSSTPY
jgi:lipopolysaccharide biosynthesis protein